MPWQTQWETLNRWYSRVAPRLAEPVPGGVAQHELLDDVHAWCMACLHMRDWLVNDPEAQVATGDIARVFADPAVLAAASVAIGQKHLRIDNERYHADAALKMSVTVRLGGTGAAGNWRIGAGGQDVELAEVMERAMSAWERFLVSRHLLAHGAKPDGV